MRLEAEEVNAGQGAEVETGGLGRDSRGGGGEEHEWPFQQAESVTGDQDVYHIHTVRPFLHARICSLTNSQIKRQNLKSQKFRKCGYQM